MKTTIRMVSVLVCLFAFAQVASAQTTFTKLKDAPAEDKPATPLSKEVTITLRNTSERPMAIFAGPKEGIRDPKVMAVGGASMNKLYLRENEIVCLVTVDKRPVACTVIKPGVTTVEINTAGTTVTSK